MVRAIEVHPVMRDDAIGIAVHADLDVVPNIGILSGIARRERQVPARHPAEEVPLTRMDAEASGDRLGNAD